MELNVNHMQISISLVFLMENFHLGTNVTRVPREAFCLLKIASAFDLRSSTRSKQISTHVDRKASRLTWASRSHLHTGAGVRVGVMCEGGQPESSWCVLPRRPSSGFYFRDKQTLVEEPLSQSEAAARRMNARGRVTFLFTFSKRTFAFFFFFFHSLSTSVFALLLRLQWNCCRLLRFEECVQDLSFSHVVHHRQGPQETRFHHQPRRWVSAEHKLIWLQTLTHFRFIS